MMANKKNWLQLLAYVTGSINQELLLRNEYLSAEKRILIACIAKPDITLNWYRKLIAQEFNCSERRNTGRPRVDAAVEQLVLDRHVRTLVGVTIESSEH
jgi:putative transposase